MQRLESYNQSRVMHTFQRACRRNYFTRLYLRLLSLRRDIAVPVPIKCDLDTDRVSYDRPKESGLVAGLLRIPMAAGSSEAPKNSSSHDHAPGNPCISGISTIIQNPALSSLFRDFLESMHCWENFAFYLEVMDFIAYYEQIKHTSPRLVISHGALAALYRLYHVFIARGSQWEVNIDQSLRSPLAALLTSVVEDGNERIESLDQVVNLLRQAQSAIFELLASDSLPKFLSRPEYAIIFREYSLHSISATWIS